MTSAGMSFCCSVRAAWYPFEFGRASVTSTLKRLLLAAALSSSVITTREYECIRMVQPSWMNSIARWQIFSRQPLDRSQKTFALSARRRL